MAFSSALFKIEDLQNISLFTISISSLFSYLYYNSALAYENYFTVPYDILLPVVALHASVDFFLTKSWDVKLHHVFIFGIIGYNYYYNVSSSDRFLFSYTLLNTEISSIFYVLKYWLVKNTAIYNINTALFYLTFFKFRIYNFYHEIINHPSSFDTIFQKYSNLNYVMSSIFVISCYGLFILNLYWFLIINKILYKNITKIININTDIVCHFLCSYLHWINIPLAFYIYSLNPNEKYIFDIIGITILSITSYMYHFDIYNRLCVYKNTNDCNVPSKDNVILFVNDCLSIHLRSFLIIVTNYYYSQHFLCAILLSGILHISSIYHCITNILGLFIDFDKTKITFFKCHNVLMAIPIACDVFLIFMNTPLEISIPFLIVNTIMGLLFVVDPFYKLTHVAFHVSLIAQNYYMCLSCSR